MQVSLLTGGFDKPYAFGVSMALADQGIRLEVIGSDEIESPELRARDGIRFLNLHGKWGSDVSRSRKLTRIAAFYVKLLRYACVTRSKVLHILWNNKVPLLDRTVLLLIYRILGKRLVFTAHNVNAGERDGTDSRLNRLTLRSQYRLVDHIFVHTRRMREELIAEYGVSPKAVTVIPFGVNNAVPRTDLDPGEARCRLGIAADEKTILFFGNIRRYKGLHHLVDALGLLTADPHATYRLIIAGSKPNREGERYWAGIQQAIESRGLAGQILQRIMHVPDEDIEMYFLAADVAALPYEHVYQSGVMSLSYSFGLPVVATDVGSFDEDVLEGTTGFLCRAGDPEDLARAIRGYFASELYERRKESRACIRSFAAERYSWNKVGSLTRKVYEDLLSAP